MMQPACMSLSVEIPLETVNQVSYRDVLQTGGAVLQVSLAKAFTWSQCIIVAKLLQNSCKFLMQVSLV